MLCIPIADLDKFAEQLLIASHRLTDGQGLRVHGGGHTPDDARRTALIALHILRGEPVHRSDVRDISEMIASMSPRDQALFKGSKP